MAAITTVWWSNVSSSIVSIIALVLLSVELPALPFRPPTITVASRHSSDSCGKVMTFNCTDNQLENLFTPPIIIWINPNGREVSTEGESNPRMDPQTRQLIFRDIIPTDGGSYVCRSIVNIPQALIINYFDEAMITVSTTGRCFYLELISPMLYDTNECRNNVVPDVVQNLKCAQSSSPTELLLSWEPPTVMGNAMVSYQVNVNKLEHRPGTKEVVQFGIYQRFNSEMNGATINQGLGT